MILTVGKEKETNKNKTKQKKPQTPKWNKTKQNKRETNNPTLSSRMSRLFPIAFYIINPNFYHLLLNLEILDKTLQQFSKL